MRNPFKRDPDPFAANRYSGLFRSVRERHRKHMRHWWQWALLGLFVAIAGGFGYGTWLYYHTQAKIQIDVEGVGGEEEGQPFNALLVGSDSRAGLTEKEQFELGAAAVSGQRADTIILAHVDPAADRVIMVQFPRDLWVPINGGAENRINSALTYGRAALVKTVSDLTGLKIHRYAQVNIAGFRDLVDAIGGVQLCITEPILFDPQTGIEITEDELGLVHFDGDRALRFVRSRHFPTGDFERIKNQQKFLAAAIDKVTSTSTLLSPTRLLKLARIAGDNVRATMNIPALRSLLDRFKSFDPEHYEAYTAPNLGTAAVGELSVVMPDMEAMKVMFEAMAANESPAEADGVPSISPTIVEVGVYNGTFEPGVAELAADQLEGALETPTGSIDVVEVANADRFDFKGHLIRYDAKRPETKTMAELVAAAVPKAEIVAGKTNAGVDVALIVGSRPFNVREVVQILPIPLPRPSALPKECT
ncbi:MAG: LCP family protein [Actinomycetota bacterium]